MAISHLIDAFKQADRVGKLAIGAGVLGLLALGAFANAFDSYKEARSMDPDASYERRRYGQEPGTGDYTSPAVVRREGARDRNVGILLLLGSLTCAGFALKIHITSARAGGSALHEHEDGEFEEVESEEVLVEFTAIENALSQNGRRRCYRAVAYVAVAAEPLPAELLHVLARLRDELRVSTAESDALVAEARADKLKLSKKAAEVAFLQEAIAEVVAAAPVSARQARAEKILRRIGAG